MPTGTVKLHRVMKAPPERVYRAFLDARVGGGFKASFTNFGKGQSHAFSGTYTELKPHEKICYYDEFDDPNLPGRMNVVVSLRAVVCGTELSIVQDRIPEAIPVEMCYLGWQESLAQLALLVEPDIPAG